jgi:hypothetical protein
LAVNEVRYNRGTFVQVANEVAIKKQKARDDDRGGFEDEDDLWIAYILGIRASDKDHVYAHIYWMYRPTDLPPATLNGRRTVQGRQPYHGARELIASNHSMF